MLLKLIACEIARREICRFVSESPHLFDLEFLPVGNHDDPEKGRVQLQERVDEVPADRFDAVLIGYGLCNRMLNGLKARSLPLVIPRAHDCLTFFLGSRRRYNAVFGANPGTYFFTTGWLDFPVLRTVAEKGKEAVRDTDDDIFEQSTLFHLGRSYEELVEKYGEDNAAYLLGVTDRWRLNYTTGMFIEFAFGPQAEAKDRVRRICGNYNWEFKCINGDLRLLEKWISGEWDEDFLIVQPQSTVYPVASDNIIEAR
ncbi:MAG: DUF1638 domain-containing protein [Verrucomicrobia bacterium]|nr:DUF1638 domain-containing protein [Verrucomicrobiota bacterium]